MNVVSLLLCSVRLVVGCRLQDPEVSSWLLDPADPATCYQDLLSKHLKTPPFPPPSPAPGTSSRVRFPPRSSGGGGRMFYGFVVEAVLKSINLFLMAPRKKNQSIGITVGVLTV